MQALVRDTDNKIIAFNKCGHGAYVRSNMTGFSLIELPTQDVSHLYEPDKLFIDERLVECYYPKDVTTFSVDVLADQIDKATDRAITTALHPVAGQGEESGIVREQLVDILNALGIEPNEGFAAYNSAAIAEITKARIEKEAL